MVADESFTLTGLSFPATDLGLNYSNIEGQALVNFFRCFHLSGSSTTITAGPLFGYSDFLP